MGGPPVRLTWRERTETGSLAGPRIFVSRFVDGVGGRGGVVEGVAEARETVRTASAEGYDYIKAYNSLTTAQWDTIAEEAGRAGLGIIGHGVRDPGLEHILETGMDMVAHGEEYIYTLFRGCDDDARARLPEAIDLTRRTGAYVLPNLSAYEIIALQWGKPPVVDSLIDQPEWRYLHPSFRRGWQGGSYTGRAGSIDPCVVFLRDMTKAFADAGLPLLLGTDSPGVPGMYPGYSIHNDARNLARAGLTPYQIMVAGTRAAGEFVAATHRDAPRFGVIEVGASADLMLLDRNPLEDVENWTAPAGVMTRGTWWSRDRLNAALEEMAASFETSSDGR